MADFAYNALTINMATAKGSDPEKILNEISGVNEDGEFLDFDFNKIIPMPEELYVIDGAQGNRGLALLYKKAIDDGDGKMTTVIETLVNEEDRFLPKTIDEVKTIDEELALKWIHNFQNYGSSTWYKWRIKHWETKWNASEASSKLEENGDISIRFQTPWAAPIPVIMALSKKYNCEVTLNTEIDCCGKGFFYEISQGELISELNYPLENEEYDL